MNTITYKKDYFSNKGKIRLNRWILQHRKELSCGALFTYTTKGLSPIIKKVEKKYSHGDFIPTHVGQIIQVGEEVMVFNQTPPKGELTRLADYIYKADFDFEIVTFSDNDFNAEQYAQDVLRFNGRNYGYFSALQSGLKFLRFIPNIKKHCSEIQTQCLQNQGYFTNVNADDMTPMDIYNLLAYNEM